MLVYRDLGGIKNKEGKTIKPNMIVRGKSLYKIKEKDIRKLKEVNLSKVIDLRTAVEADEKPNTIIDKIKYLHMPIFKEKTAGITHEKEENKLKMLKNMVSIENLYKLMVTDKYSIEQLKNIIHEIINSDTYPVLFHCTAGKDRTGVVAMLLLNILDVDKKTIMSNYLEINKKHKPKANLFYVLINVLVWNKELAKKARSYYMVHESYLETAIAAIKETYGTIDNYIKEALGVTDEMKQAFKDKVLA